MRSKIALMLATIFLLLGALESAAYAQRHRRQDGGRVGSGFHRGGSYTGRRIIVVPSFGYGWGYNPYWWGDPWYRYGRFGYDFPVQVEHINYGTVKFDVKPENTRVYIDEKLVGTVDDLDNEKAYVSGGQHQIRLEAPNGQILEKSVFVAVGKKVKIDRDFRMAH